MKRIAIISLFYLMIVTNANAQDTIRVFYDKDWNVTSDTGEILYYRKAFLNTSKAWEANDYYISGKLQMKGTYQSKKLEVKHGHFIFYYENGQKRSEGSYLNNALVGIWTYWENNGKLQSSGNYRNNLRNGKWTYWNFDGRIIMEGNFKNDLQDGEWNRYFPASKLVIHLKDGNILDKSYGGMERVER